MCEHHLDIFVIFIFSNSISKFRGHYLDLYKKRNFGIPTYRWSLSVINIVFSIS